MSLKRDAFWTAADIGLSAGLSFALRLLAARLLLPEEFGYAAIALATYGIMQVVADFGLTATLINQDKGAIAPELIKTTFTVSVCAVAGLIILTSIVVGPLMASLYGKSELRLLVPALAASLLASPFSSISSAMLQRERKFKAVTIARVYSTTSATILALGVLFWKPTVWVFVCQAVVSQYVFAFLLYRVMRWPLGLGISKQKFRQIFGFSGLVLLNDAFVAFANHVPILLLGRVLTAADIGLLSIATFVTDTLRRSLMSVLNRVMFVHYSSNKNEKAAIKNAYVKTIAWNCTLVFPSMVAMIYFGPALIPIILGSAWLNLGPVLQILAISVMVHAAGGTTSTLYKAIGKPGLDLALFAATTVLVLFPALVIGGLYCGLVGVAVGILATKIISIALRQVILDRMLGSTMGLVLKVVFKVLLLQAPIVLASVACAKIAAFTDLGWYVALATVSVAVTYGLSLWSQLKLRR